MGLGRAVARGSLGLEWDLPSGGVCLMGAGAETG